MQKTKVRIFSIWNKQLVYQSFYCIDTMNLWENSWEVADGETRTRNPWITSPVL